MNPSRMGKWSELVSFMYMCIIHVYVSVLLCVFGFVLMLFVVCFLMCALFVCVMLLSGVLLACVVLSCVFVVLCLCCVAVL